LWRREYAAIEEKGRTTKRISLGEGWWEAWGTIPGGQGPKQKVGTTRKEVFKSTGAH